ncbi:MAG: 30S ribosomal protein S20 [Nitrospirota bacterium]
MPSTKPKKSSSVKKRGRQAEKRNLRNRSVKSRIKTLTKRVLEAAEKKDKELVEASLREAIKEIDSAASKGVLHRNTASRKVSRLTRRASALTSEAA